MERITKVYLLNVPLENDYKHTLYFNSLSGQTSYFQSRIVKSYTDFSYQRKDSFIRVPDHFDDIQNCNYAMYQNTSNSNKWYYAFITDMKYIDDGRTDVYIETDYLQTWYFDITIKPSFVEREHVLDDTVGLHTVPEGLETGDYITNNEQTLPIFQDCEPVLAVTELPGSTENDAITEYNGLFQGCSFIGSGEEGLLGGEIGTLEHIINHYANSGKADSIQAIFMAPTEMTMGTIKTNVTGWSTDKMVTYKQIDESSGSWGTTILPISKPTTINGYTPKNNKLLTYPYRYINVDNNVGNCAQYKYEYFADKIMFSVEMALVPGISTKLVPNNYQNLVNNYHHSITCGKLPICSWSSDVYTNWLVQNSANIAVSNIGSALQIVGGVAAASTGFGAISGGAMVTSGALGIANTMASVHQHSLIPSSLEGNLNGGDVNYAIGLHNPILYHMSIKQEYAKIIDKYFDMFGYKVNMVKQPNTHHRARYWYTKTIDVNIDGPIPAKDMQVIKNCYNNGITFWRNASEIQNYSLSNGISNVA